MSPGKGLTTALSLACRNFSRCPARDWRIAVNLQEWKRQKNDETKDYRWVGKDTAPAPISEEKRESFQSQSLVFLDRCAREKAF